MFKNKFSKAGFTVVEVAIVMPIVALIVLALISTSVRLINQTTLQNSITKRMAELQLALDTIEHDISYSTAFIPKIECPNPPSGYKYCYGSVYEAPSYKMRGINDTPHKSNNRFVLKTLMTTNNPLDTRTGIKLVHYRLPNLTDCSVNNPVMASVFYSIDWRAGGSLYRTIATNNALNSAACETPWQKNEETMLLENASMEVEFFNASEPNKPLTGIFGNFSDENVQKVLREAISVQVTLKSRVYATASQIDEPVIVTGKVRVSRIQ